MPNNDDQLSIAIEKALLKLSTEHGIAIPKDDYVLCQIYLNKAILDSMFEGHTEVLKNHLNNVMSEGEKNKDFFKQALIKSASISHQREIKYKRFFYISATCSALSFLFLCSTLIYFNL